MAEDLYPLLVHNIGPAGDGDDSDSDSISTLGSGPDRDEEEELVEDEDEDNEDEELVEDEEGVNAAGGRNQNDGGERDGSGHRNRTSSRLPRSNFDSSLPGTHSYLGQDLEDIRGRTVHDDNALVTIPLLPLPGVVLVPGEVIPLHLFQQTLIAAIRRLADTDKTFGVVTYRMKPDLSPGFSEIGCTAELFSMKDETDESVGFSILRALARGRQRFKVIDSHRDVTGILMAKVQILPEIWMPRCLGGARPTSYDKFNCSPTEQDDVVKTAVDRQGNVLKSVNMMLNRQLDRFTAAHLTRWPPWVYKLYDADRLKDQIIRELHSWNDTLQTTSLPTDATELSYWVAQNLPLDNAMRMHLLGVACPVHRLRSELAIMKKCAVLCCKSCMKQVARKEDMFSLSMEGPLGAYVNPGGHVYETLTFYKANSLRLIGRPSTEHSWFPGYAWTIAQCVECNNHMGWRFTAAKKKLTPDKFFGLCRSSLIPSFRKNTGQAVEEGSGVDAGDDDEDGLILEGW